MKVHLLKREDIAFPRCRWRSGLAAVLITLALLVHPTAIAQAFPAAAWTVSTPEQQGVDSRALADFYEALQASRVRIDSVLIIRHGQIVSEVYFPPYRAGLLHDLRSVTKSIVSTLVGVAQMRGDLHSVDDRVLGFFPWYEPHDDRQRALTVRNLLEMRTGIGWREWPYDSKSDVLRMAASSNWVEYILDRPMSEPPGTTFRYVGAAPHLLSAVLTRTTGRAAEEFAKTTLFEQLGIKQWSWAHDPSGNSTGESGLSLDPRDVARIGYLYVRDGVWQGRRLLPEEWTRRLFSEARAHGLRAASQLPPQYDLLWWVDGSVPFAMASGRHGQHLVVLPRHDAVLVVTGKTNDASSTLNMPQLVRSHLLPALGVSARANDPQAQHHLRDTLARLTKPVPMQPVAAGEPARAIASNRYEFAANALNLRSIEISFTRSAIAHFTMGWRAWTPSGEERLTRPFGADGQYASSSPTQWGTFASRGGWIDQQTLVIESELLQGSTVTTLQLRFKDNRLALTISDNDGARTELIGRVVK